MKFGPAKMAQVDKLFADLQMAEYELETKLAAIRSQGHLEVT